MAENHDVAASMRAVYQSTMEGGNLPKLVVMNGASINQLLDTDEYDPNAAYVVSSAGIEKVFTE